MQHSKRVVVAGVAFLSTVVFAVSAAHGQGGQNEAKTKKIRIVTVVKRTKIAWFERMEQGIKQFAAQNGVDATMIGADDADPQKQVDIIRKLIREKPDAITVVPNSPEALETAYQGVFSTTIAALIVGWMLQKTRTMPSRWKMTVRLVPGGYRPMSKIWPLKFEKALWKIGSKFGKLIAEPRGTARICGVKRLFF